ncbi:hypothetical protein AMR42_01980 [Limnothrix sp. PR1529]|nr:hypothetical protein BCR12_00855 [Limnothrix sp. P13C2]PIB15283.1 hypothetical protein AMR42_01980 [Limnothrix sp. PR1529]
MGGLRAIGRRSLGKSGRGWRLCWILWDLVQSRLKIWLNQYLDLAQYLVFGSRFGSMLDTD